MRIEKYHTVDAYSLKDKAKFGANSNKRLPGPLTGWVEIFKNNKKIFEGSNMVVGLGREFVAQKIFDMNGDNPNSWTQFKVSHFAVGSGGATITNSNGENVVTLNGPVGNDEHLYNAISLNNSGYLTEPSNVEHACKPISEITFQQVEIPSEGGTNYYTDVLCVCKIESGDLADTTEINEAGLYYVYGSTTKLFAHICFPSKWIEPDSVFEIYWTIRT